MHVLAEYCLSNHNIKNTTACGTGVWGEGKEGGKGGGGLSDFIKGNNSRILWFLYIIDGGVVSERPVKTKARLFSASVFFFFCVCVCVFVVVVFVVVFFVFVFWLIFVCFSDVNFPGRCVIVHGVSSIMSMSQQSMLRSFMSNAFVL